MAKKKGKLQIKGFVTGFLVCALLGTAVVVSANTGGVMREVFFGVNVVVNGQQQIFPDDMAPFISDGRTFLPVRGIAEALDVPVNWDGTARTVYIGTIPHGMEFFSNIPPFQQSRELRTFSVSMLGNTYHNALSIGQSAAINASWWGEYNLNAQFNSLSMTMGRMDDNRDGHGSISFYGDGRHLGTFTVDRNTTDMQDIQVDLRGVLILRIEMNRYRSGGTPFFINDRIE